MNDRLTQSDIDKMQQEIEHRKLVLRPQLLVDVKEARAHGDLSENFEYKAAKKAKNQNESRIRYLEKMIKTARIIEDNTADDEVGINNQVTVLFEEDGGRCEPDESQHQQNERDGHGFLLFLYPTTGNSGPGSYRTALKQANGASSSAQKAT